MRALGGWAVGIRPRRANLRQDIIAGLPGAVSGVPDGMAASVLTGINPVHGLYASTFGPIGGGLTSSSKLMVITTTSAAALAAGSAIASVPGPDRARAIFLLTVLTGVLTVTAGILRFGRYTRFVPHSVMIGFLTGIAANIVLGQLPHLLGGDATGPYALAKAWDLVTHPSSIDAATTIAGCSALLILVALSKTPLSTYSSLVALVVPSVVVTLLGTDSVARVREVGEIPSGLPMPVLPHLSDLTISLVIGACSVAALVLVQGAGVSESSPNPDGTKAEPNRDFVAQGIGNVVAGVFQGQPVGGSVGRTALNVSAGARSRWASIFSGIWMAVILLAFSGVVGNVVMSTLAAVLIYAAIGSVRTGSIRAILQTGRISQIAVISTFGATLFLPVAAAVGFGVVLSLLMQLNQEAMDLRVVKLEPDEAGHFVEGPAPRTLPSHRVVLLDIYGSLFYAGAKTLQARLPDPAGSESPVVVLRLRGRATLGSTAFAVLADYAHDLEAVGGRLYLSGVDPGVAHRLRHGQPALHDDKILVFEATPGVGESSLDAYHAALGWLADRDTPGV